MTTAHEAAVRAVAGALQEVCTSGVSWSGTHEEQALPIPPVPGDVLDVEAV